MYFLQEIKIGQAAEGMRKKSPDYYPKKYLKKWLKP